ncbi:Family with sequence similarity 46, member [Cichlidogyrus casuarinus]|uniref:polynucleotide adenylyltransferase n=1 Tax=Cichlidogyrus casuarinus TaxID=1844966 RepID=A0ABD2QJA0_9PLAT
MDLSSCASTISRVKALVLAVLVGFLPVEREANENYAQSLGEMAPAITPCSDSGISCSSSNASTHRRKSVSITEMAGGSNGLDSNTPSSVWSCCESSRPFSFRESYVYKQFRMYSHESDCWSLLALGKPTEESKVVELKFVDRMRRQYEFTIDSFQILLNTLLSFYESKPAKMEINEHWYPTVVAESVAGSYVEALNHLNSRLIVTKNPETIRGGGLLKYCKLLANGFQIAPCINSFKMEKYMCSRFFIDFSDLLSQKLKIQSYLSNHFDEHDWEGKLRYLSVFYQVVSGSTICLMSQDHYRTLKLVESLMRSMREEEEMF